MDFTDPCGVTVDLVVAPESRIFLCYIVWRLLSQHWLHQLRHVDVLPDELHCNNLLPFQKDYHRNVLMLHNISKQTKKIQNLDEEMHTFSSYGHAGHCLFSHRSATPAQMLLWCLGLQWRTRPLYFPAALLFVQTQYFLK